MAPDSPTARDREWTPTTPRPSRGQTSAPENASSPPPVAAPRPIRLRGRTDVIDLATGETGLLYDTAAEPEGVLTVPCGNRREAVCPPCSQVYKGRRPPARPRGPGRRQGIPGTITAYPCVFATLTAPSFGPVHARRMRGNTVLPCRPRRDAHARRCPHGRDISCPTRHRESDPRLGQPMCPDCYDYQAAVLFNAYAGDLWRRFITYLPRQLARRLGITQKQLRTLVRIRYVKVAEYQARGVVHFHAVIRLDSPEKDHQPPPPGIDAAALSDATGQSRFRAWAHMLGYGGHFLTKSRRYSVTFGQLRQARTDHRRAERHPGGEHDPWGGPLEENVVLITKAWTYAGTGYTGVAGDAVALAAAARARERQDHAA